MLVTERIKRKVSYRSAFDRLQSAILEPHAITIVMIVVYAIMMLIGTIALFDHPSDIRVLLGGSVSIAWAWLLVAGGVLGVASAPVGYWDIETLAVSVQGFGLFLYLLGLFFAQAPWPTLTIRAGFTLITGLLLFTRFLRVRQMRLSPGEPLIERPETRRKRR